MKKNIWKYSPPCNDSTPHELHIPEGITGIDSGCFASHTQLKMINLPDSLRDIGVGAFEGCTSLEAISLPEGITRLRKSTFCGCHSLREVILPKTLSGIGEWAFRDCRSLKRIMIPAGVADICAEVFLGDDGLVIAGEPGSYAEKYAQEFHFIFESVMLS